MVTHVVQLSSGYTFRTDDVGRRKLFDALKDPASEFVDVQQYENAEANQAAGWTQRATAPGEDLALFDVIVADALVRERGNKLCDRVIAEHLEAHENNLG